MPHNEELLGAAIAVWGTRELRGGDAVPWARFEAWFSTDLTGRTDQPSQTRVYAEGTGAPAAPSAWVGALAAKGAVRMALVEPTAAAVAKPPGWEAPPDARMLHAFAGTGGVLLLSQEGEEWRAWRTRIGRTPPTLLTKADVLAFLHRQHDPEAIRRSLLWEDAHNLHVTDGTSWRAFLEALGPEHDEELVRTLDRVLGNVRFTHGELEAWVALKRAHPNPKEAWQYALVDSGAVQGAPIESDVAGLTSRLEAALLRIAAFARGAPKDSYAEPWAEDFDRARALLGGAGAGSRVRDLFEGSGMDRAALRLLLAASEADVFGGMGSWNDLGLRDDAEYGRVSADLYACLLPSLVAAVNASTAP